MDKKRGLTRILAIAGTVLLWFPLIAMVVLAVLHLVRSGQLMADYLIPGELFFVVLAGAALLLWAALRSKILLKPVVWGCVLAVATLVLSQTMAVVTGLASGLNEFSGWRMVLVAGLLILYDLAVLFLAITGIRLITALLKKPA